MRKNAIIILILFSIITVAGYAQNLGGKEKKTSPAKKETIDGRADYVKGSWGGSQEIVIMKGNVKFVHSDIVLKSDEIQYNQKTKTAVSHGKINISSPELNIIGDKGTAYFDKRIGVVEGNVILNYTPKNNSNNNEENIKKEANK
ncbi:MAG: hypothetical protein SNJ70_10350, partial [Armatimonadota bacterium]